LAEMSAVDGVVPELSGDAANRADAALARRSAPDEFDTDAARRVFTQMVGDERTQRKTGS
jgi:hypothetical protein